MDFFNGLLGLGLPQVLVAHEALEGFLRVEQGRGRPAQRHRPAPLDLALGKIANGATILPSVRS